MTVVIALDQTPAERWPIRSKFPIQPSLSRLQMSPAMLPPHFQRLRSMAVRLEWADLLWELEQTPDLLEWRAPEGTGLLSVLGSMPGAEAVIPAIAAAGFPENKAALGDLLAECIEADNRIGLRTLGAFEALLAIGAPPDSHVRHLGGCGITLLQLAIVRNQPEFVRLLLVAGADPTIPERDFNPQDAFATAKEHQNDASSVLLEWKRVNVS